MNEPQQPPFNPTGPAPAAEPEPSLWSQVEDLIRRHPIAAALTTMGLGCAVGMAARELLIPAPPPRHRAMQLLEDIKDRLADIAQPVGERISHLAEDGVNVLKHGIDSATHSKIGNRLRNFFS